MNRERLWHEYKMSKGKDGSDCNVMANTGRQEIKERVKIDANLG